MKTKKIGRKNKSQSANQLNPYLNFLIQNANAQGDTMKSTTEVKLKEIQAFVGAKEIFLAHEEICPTQFFPSGSLYLNKILGTNGWPRGRIVEIYGPESCGKSSLALKAIAEIQKMDGNTVYIDLEGSLDLKWAQILGVDPKNLMVAKPNSGEQAVTIINALIKTKLVDLIVVDSVASMVPQNEIEANFHDQSVGLHARLMSKAMRLIQASLLQNNRTCIIFINQTRMKIGVSYGPNTTTTGGIALKFAASIRLELKKYEAIRESSDIVGYYIKASVVKNKLAAPMHTALLPFYFKTGFDEMSEIITEAIKYEVLTKKGTWFYYKNQNLGQGIKMLREKFEKEPNLYQEIQKLVFNHLNLI